jgi:hypothetical protein
MNSRRDMCRHVFHVLFVYHLKSNCNQIVISRLEFIFSEPKSTKKHSVIVYKYNIAHKISHYNTKYIIILYHIIVVLFCVTLFCVILYYFVLYCSPGIPYPPWSPPWSGNSESPSLIGAVFAPAGPASGPWPWIQPGERVRPAGRGARARAWSGARARLAGGGAAAGPRPVTTCIQASAPPPGRRVWSRTIPCILAAAMPHWPPAIAGPVPLARGRAPVFVVHNTVLVWTTVYRQPF